MRRFDLPPMAASGLVGMLDQTEYISVIWVTAAIGSALTAGHFGKEPQSNQRALAPPLGTSPRLGVPVIRQGFGGPPPRAIHGAGRLNRHPCRFTPQIPVEFRPAWFNGAPEIKSRSRAARFASWLGGLRSRLTHCADPIQGGKRRVLGRQQEVAHVRRVQHVRPNARVQRGEQTFLAQALGLHIPA